MLKLVVLIFFSPFSLADIKKAEKALKSADYAEVMTQLNAAEALISGADSEQKASFYTIKGIALAKTAKGDFNKVKLASEAFKKAMAADSKMSPMLTDGIS